MTEADDFLLRALRHGSRPAADVLAEGAGRGISGRALRRSRERLGRSFRAPGRNAWRWELHPGVAALTLAGEAPEPRPASDGRAERSAAAAPPVAMEGADAMGPGLAQDDREPEPLPEALTGDDGDGGPCALCGTWRCPSCGRLIARGYVAHHKAGTDASYPQCPRQDLAAARELREPATLLGARW